MEPNAFRAKGVRRHKRQRLIEGEDDAVDTIMVERTFVDTPTGSTEQKTIVPVRLDEARRSTNQIPVTAAGGMEMAGWEDAAGYGSAEWGAGADDAGADGAAGDDNMGAPPRRQRHDQAFYMQEFVSHVDDFLQSLLSKETLPVGKCANCSERQCRWRCKECFLAQPLCRTCMRHTHMKQPFHRIERWTGTHFQSADLWQVGVYLRLGHTDLSTPCEYLLWQDNQLENFQKVKDEVDESEQSIGVPGTVPVRNVVPAPVDIDADQTAADIEFMNNMNRLYHTPKDINDIPDLTLEEDDDHGSDDPESDVCNDELSNNQSATAASASLPPSASAPLKDGLNNSYVRIIHTNGVHHLPLARCSCSGTDALPCDLIHAGLMPTSFKRVRTLFTLAVLDQFRYSNLEMKASAYQFFQMLRRITSPMAPTNAVNFYHELRRLSRLWRWMKKLKWAGFGHKAADPMNVAPGELSIFCPACPQPGINLPDDWELDPNRWVYKRFFVADGNFKADHVRQKRSAPDIWLSEGGGMMTRIAEYKEFLRTAIKRLTVSCHSFKRYCVVLPLLQICSRCLTYIAVAAHMWPLP